MTNKISYPAKTLQRFDLATQILVFHFIKLFAELQKNKKFRFNYNAQSEDEINALNLKYYKIYEKEYLKREEFNEGDLFIGLNSGHIRTGIHIFQVIRSNIKKRYIKKTHFLYPRYETWLKLKSESMLTIFE